MGNYQMNKLALLGSLHDTILLNKWNPLKYIGTLLTPIVMKIQRNNIDYFHLIDCKLDESI